MIVVALIGICRSVRGCTLCQSIVPTETMIITATSAAIGILATAPPNPTTRTSRNTPARNVEIRVRAPETLTLIIVWPIMAQPPIPPNKPVTMFATPCPKASRVLFEWVSVMSSTSFAVISDSSRPTIAIANAYGAMIVNVSNENGTCGMNSVGQAVGQRALVADVGDVHAEHRRRGRSAGR